MLDQHLEKLRVFFAVAQDLSMVRAARRLSVSQPAVSKAIQNLEGVLGQDLFQRRSGGLSLTPAGQHLMAYAERLFASVTDLEQELSHLGELSGVLRIGTFETLAEVVWPQTLVHLRKLYPNLLVHLETEGTQSIWSKLKSGSLDMIIDAEPETSPALVSKVLYKDEFQIFQPAKGMPINNESLLALSYVEAATDRKNQRIRELLTANGVEHRLMYSVQSFPFVRSLVVAGACYGVMPTRLAAGDLRSGLIKPYQKDGKPVIFGEHRICATFPEHSRNSLKVKAVVEGLKRCLGA